MGWRAVIGVVLIGTLVLHGFDRSFVVDGYTITLLGLLLVLALAGELESARFAGFDVRFRKRMLVRIEQDLDDLPPPAATEPEGADTDDADADRALQEEHIEKIQAELRSLAREEPTAAVATFFIDVERAVNGLYKSLVGDAVADPTLRQQVDVLARYGVIPPSEARIVLELAGLRNAYVNGGAVDPREAARLIAVGARILPSLSQARRNVGRAFEQRVEEVLAKVDGLSFERQPVVEMDGRRYRPDFLITAPWRIPIEAKLASIHLADRLPQAEVIQRACKSDEVLVVVPQVAPDRLERLRNRAPVTVMSIDRLEAWLRERMDKR